MAVYTQISQKEISSIQSNFNLEKIVKFKGIKQGIENTNYFLITKKNKYVLTIFEKRVKKSELPFFMKLMDRLSLKGISCPRPLKNKKENYLFNTNSKETFILVNNWFMAFYLATVFIGSIYPIFTEVIGDAKISVGPPFYNIVIIPLVIPFLIFMALGPKAKWIKNYVRNIFFGMTAIIFAIIINFLINYYFKSYSILSNLIIVSSIFLILYSLKDLIEYYRKNISFDISRIISHLGFGLLVFLLE